MFRGRIWKRIRSLNNIGRFPTVVVVPEEEPTVAANNDNNDNDENNIKSVANTIPGILRYHHDHSSPSPTITAKRSVHFHTQVMIHDCMPRSDLTAQERLDCWCTKEDFKAFKSDSSFAAYIETRGHGNTLFDDVRYTLRGSHYRLASVSKQRREWRRQTKEAVFGDDQDQKIDGDEVKMIQRDDSTIAAKYSIVSKEALSAAQAMAHEDENDARLYYRQEAENVEDHDGEGDNDKRNDNGNDDFSDGWIKSLSSPSSLSASDSSDSYHYPKSRRAFVIDNKENRDDMMINVDDNAANDDFSDGWITSVSSSSSLLSSDDDSSDDSSYRYYPKKRNAFVIDNNINNNNNNNNKKYPKKRDAFVIVDDTLPKKRPAFVVDNRPDGFFDDSWLQSSHGVATTNRGGGKFSSKKNHHLRRRHHLTKLHFVSS